jgi:hypothetical protein
MPVFKKSDITKSNQFFKPWLEEGPAEVAH